MALDFPASPGPGQTFVAGGVTWTWDGSKWVFQGAAGSGFYLPLTGGTVSGPLTVTGNTSLQALTCSSINGAPAVFPAMRNKLINGGMDIDQRFSGAAQNAVAANPAWFADRWQLSQSPVSKFNIGQNLGAIAPPAGFSNYIGAQVAAGYVPAAAEFMVLQHTIEGVNIGDLGWGTAGAKAVTLSFWARSSVTGTHSASLANNGGTRCYPFTFSIGSANTWTQISVTIPGDTAGTWLTTTGIGIYLRFVLGSGSTYRGPAGAWTATNYLGVTGAVSVVSTTGNTFQITGVQLEAGSVATPYEWRDCGLTLALCQRYYQKIGGGAATCCVYQSYTPVGGANMSWPTGLPVAMRTTPTVTVVGTWTTSNAGTINFYPSQQEVSVQLNPPAAGGLSFYSTGASAYLSVSAEL